MKLKLLLLIIVTLLVPAFADEWGDWDDLPDDLFSVKSGEPASLETVSQQLQQLIDADDDSASYLYIQQWLKGLDNRLIVDNDELAELLEDLSDEEGYELIEELDDWLEDQMEALEEEREEWEDEQDDLQDELDDLDDEQDDDWDDGDDELDDD